MSNGRITFKVPSGEYTLHFGMRAREIYSKKGFAELQAMVERGDKKPNGIKTMAIIIYAGLCNYADIKEVNEPTFEEAYILLEELLMQPEDVQKSVFDTWENSSATKDMLSKLGQINDEAEKKSLQTG